MREEYQKVWNEKFEELAAFYHKNGHVHVSLRCCPSLYKWTYNQRTTFRLGRMPLDRIQKLEAIGFFDFQKDEHIWERKFERLVTFKARCGHVQVPSSNYGLHNWVLTQRRLFQQGKMPREQADRLKSLGMSLSFTILITVKGQPPLKRYVSDDLGGEGEARKPNRVGLSPDDTMVQRKRGREEHDADDDSSYCSVSSCDDEESSALEEPCQKRLRVCMTLLALSGTDNRCANNNNNSHHPPTITPPTTLHHDNNPYMEHNRDPRSCPSIASLNHVMPVATAAPAPAVSLRTHQIPTSSRSVPASVSSSPCSKSSFITSLKQDDHAATVKNHADDDDDDDGHGQQEEATTTTKKSPSPPPRHRAVVRKRLPGMVVVDPVVSWEVVVGCMDDGTAFRVGLFVFFLSFLLVLCHY